MRATTVLLTTFGSVLLAELAGDRTLYTVTSLSSRFGSQRVLFGIVPAFAMKMGVAVLFGATVSRLPPAWIAAITGVTWTVTAWFVWRGEDERHPTTTSAPMSSFVAFASIALTEWGDPGQLTAALLAGRFRAPLLVWSAATAALLTKSAGALLFGTAARRYLAHAWLRFSAVAFCAVNAVIAVVSAVRTR